MHLPMISSASRIVDSRCATMMDHGKVVQRGPHEQLIADEEGLYASLVHQN